jgi:hypothetical protein
MSKKEKRAAKSRAVETFMALHGVFQVTLNDDDFNGDDGGDGGDVVQLEGDEEEEDRAALLLLSLEPFGGAAAAAGSSARILGMCKAMLKGNATTYSTPPGTP